MYKVFPMTDASACESLCLRCAIPYRESFPLYAIETERGLVGAVSFYMDGGNAVIDYVGDVGHALEEDFEPFFVCVRQVLNVMDCCGAHDGYFLHVPDSRLRLATAVGFRKQPDGRYYMDLRDFFIEPCQHDKKE